MLLIGATKKGDTLRFHLHTFWPFVRLGGVILIDEYLTNTEVFNFVHDEQKGVAYLCKVNFHCVGALSNPARASSTWREEVETMNGVSYRKFEGGHVPKYNGVYVMVRVR